MQNTNSCNKYFHLVQFQLKQYYSEIVSVLVFIYVLNLLFFLNIIIIMFRDQNLQSHCDLFCAKKGA